MIVMQMFAAILAATVTETSLEMKTYPFFDPNPVPATEEARYPYFFFDGTSSTNFVRTWKTVVLENDRIAVTMVPEIGGKIWGARDKKTGRDFIYHNHVVKFRNISQRGPWCSGGIEFNFGIIGHGPWTATPVSYFTRKNADGSVSCFVSETELVTLATWQVEVNLKPDAEGFTTRTIWFNGSGLQMPYYQWMNAAFPLSKDARFEYPGTAYIGHDGSTHAWPVDKEGHDLSHYCENAFGGPKSEHIVQGDNGFYGIWWPGEDGAEGLGFAHRNHVTQKYGRKVWLWPLSRNGAIWEDLLTDADGQYTELQSGRAFNQPEMNSYKTPFKHPTFAPGATDVFEEEWSVVRDPAVFKDAWANKGNYSERPQETPADFDWETAYGHYLKGEQMLRQRFDRQAEPELLKAVEKEPYFVPALGQLAMLAVRRAEYAKAHAFAAKALSVNTYDATANYSDGLAFWAEGKCRAAKERLGLAAYSPEFRSAAFSAVARIELREGRLDVAAEMANKALLANALDFDALLVKIVAARLSGDAAAAKALAADVLARLPLFHAARYELNRLGGGEPFEKYVRNELPQETYLSLGSWYESAGQLDDAAAFFARAGERTAVGRIREAFVRHLSGDEAAADAALRAAEKMSVDFALPFRRETLPALAWAAQANPSWKFAYLEAVLLASFARDAEADRLLDDCGERPDTVTFYLFRASRRSGDKALADIRLAERHGRSWRTGHALYVHYDAAGKAAEALAALEPYVREMPSNILNIDYANALVRAGRPGEAMAFMEKTTFLPSEHGDNASGAWLDACRTLVTEALSRGDRAAAETAAAQAASYPENLGVGRPYDLSFKPGTAKRRNPLADWTGEAKSLLEAAFEKSK